MPNAEDVLAGFERSEYGYDWFGDAAYSFWGGRSLETFIAIYDDIPSPTRRQIRLLDKLLNAPRNIRPEVEQALFEHYQTDIYGSVSEFGRDDQWEELTPTLTSSGEIWDLLGEPSVQIAYLTDDEPDDGIRFRLSYIDCPWDNEHGFGIQIEDWKIAEFGGEVG